MACPAFLFFMFWTVWSRTEVCPARENAAAYSGWRRFRQTQTRIDNCRIGCSRIACRSPWMNGGFFGLVCALCLPASVDFAYCKIGSKRVAPLRTIVIVQARLPFCVLLDLLRRSRLASASGRCRCRRFFRSGEGFPPRARGALALDGKGEGATRSV